MIPPAAESGGGAGSAFASPRFNNSRTKVRRNDTFLTTMGDDGSAANTSSPFRNMNYESKFGVFGLTSNKRNVGTISSVELCLLRKEIFISGLNLDL